jgi:tRNA 2-thiocytidine biosynthesis protein TtcA
MSDARLIPIRTLAGSPPDSRKEKYNTDKLHRRLRRQVGKAVVDYDMIQDGDRIMVCLSGGKDSFAMLDLLMNLKRSAPVSFDLIAVNLDQKQPGFPEHVLPDYLESLGIEWHVIEKDTYSVVKRLIPEGKTTCGLCSRLRRGNLYEFAARHGMTKIALGHHLNDIVETFFLNLFFGASLRAMPPKLRSDCGRHIVIRPLAYCLERDLERFAAARDYPIIPCNLCGSQPNLQRQNIKAMLSDWERIQPGRTMNIFRALGKVSPSQLCDRELFDFSALGRVSTGDRD